MNKREKNVLMTAGIALFTVVGLFFLRRFLLDKDYESFYKELSGDLEKRYGQEENHGVEFLAML